MMSLFLNPWTFVAGGLLVSLPIIIHLINRIRFQRVKWAAMEFLLKAQKRMRRRKILEQLVLLLLRCLLVFFVGLLFARFTGCEDPTKGGSGSNQSRPTTHIVILDDTPSMADAWRREDGTNTNAYREGKEFVTEKLMPALAEATTPQTLYVVRLTEPDQSFPKRTKPSPGGEGKEIPRTEEELRTEARVNAKSIGTMKDYLLLLEASTVRRSLVDGLRKAKEMLDASAGNDARVIHVVSDLRQIDWTTDGPTITDLLRELKEAGVAVHLVDVANPARKPERKSPSFSDNVSIVELKPRNRVVSVNQQTEIEVRVKNFGNTDLKDVRIDFYLNGNSDIAPQPIQFPTLPANQERSQITIATLKQGGTKDKPLDRFNILTAVLGTPEPGGLTVDNTRHTIIEVRDTVKVLVIDGRTVEGGVDLRKRSEGDSHYLRTLFQMKSQELGNIEVVDGDYANLDKTDLRPYTTVYLMNVPGLSDPAIARLEQFVKEGGGVGVFLGDNVKPENYTDKMHRGTAGFFPVPLKEKKLITKEQADARLLSFTKRFLLRSQGNKFHPALSRIYLDDRGEPLKNDGVEPYFVLVNIDGHWEVNRRGAWRDDKSVQELYCLQNDSPMARLESDANKLIGDIRTIAESEAKFEKARKYLTGANGLLQQIRQTTITPGMPLSELARNLDSLLCDQINTGDESEPILRDFWMQPELVAAKQRAMLLRDEAKYGDPLYIVKQFGRGRVAIMTTDAGGTYKDKKQWNDWPSLKGSPSWVVIVGEMQKYLSGGGGDANRVCGDNLTADFDVERYEPVVQVHSLTADGLKPQANRTIPVTLKEIGTVTMDTPTANPDPEAPKKPFQLKYGDTKQSGAYLFTLKRKKGEGPQFNPTGKPDVFADVDFLGIAVNVDAISEGDLRRANTDDLEQYTGKLPLHDPGDTRYIESLKQKPSDMSSGHWIYLVLLLLLIAEQAWAVRTSYHTKPEDLELHSPTAAASYSRTVAPSTNGEAAPVPAAVATSE